MYSFRKNIFICSAKRSPIGSFLGALQALSGVELGIQTSRGALMAASKDPEFIKKVDSATLGCVLQAGQGQAPARQVALGAGLSESAQAMTINKVCSSGLKAVMIASEAIELGHSSIHLAGGFESMSSAPYYLRTARTGMRLGHAAADDSIIRDGLWDVYGDKHMGNCAETCASEYKISRESQDAFAAASYEKALSAIKAGFFEAEIAPLSVPAGKVQQQVAIDEEPGRYRPDKLAELRPAFDKNGTVTAINASSLNDGAAVLVLASEEAAKEQGLTPIARVVAEGWFASTPEWFTTAPVGAVKSLLKGAGLSCADIDLFELNEAFSVMALACQRDLEIPSEKLNIQGGAVALGHPIGASGARILVTLIHALHRTGGKRGIASLCNGGGEATALLIERV
jgi:acetyl-CoA C-acetyltransferase